MQTTSVIVPTRNESKNIPEFLRRIDQQVESIGICEVIFVDDSDDETPEVIASHASMVRTDVRILHRNQEERAGGLSSAVITGIEAALGDWFVVMDGDLQHRPEDAALLVNAGQSLNADIVVGTRYRRGGSNAGLNGPFRKLISGGGTVVARIIFPIRLKNCTDVMSGFFAASRSSVPVHKLEPQGFKILLEILASHRMSMIEVPIVFVARSAGESKATFKQGLIMIRQLASLRMRSIFR